MQLLTPYPITPIGSFIGFTLALLPLLSNIRKFSPAVWGYAIWISIFNFTNFVDTIVWHNNVNFVIPVWCDIVTKLQVGGSFGTRACTLAICIHLFQITRFRGPPVKTPKQRRELIIYELLIMAGMPIIIMGLFIVVQPSRFQILEEYGCQFTEYSYVAYIIQYAPLLISSISCAILASLTMRKFLRHRKEMNEFLSSSGDMKYKKYHRLMFVVCMDTFFNLPVLVIDLAVAIAQGKEDPLNYPYVSWKNVHDGGGGHLPEESLGVVDLVPARAWSTRTWSVFVVKWNEWIYVLHAVLFFCVFGLSPEMRSRFRAAFWFIPVHLGYKKRVSNVESISDMSFGSNPQQDASGNRPVSTRPQDSLSLQETTIGSTISTGTHSRFNSDLEAINSRCDVEMPTTIGKEEREVVEREA